MAEKKLRLLILPPARDEILEIARLHLELVGPQSARKITEQLREALDRLCTHPRMGRKIEDNILDRQGYRKLIVGNYLCFYRQIENNIFVYHVVDGRANYPKIFSSLPQD